MTVSMSSFNQDAKWVEAKRVVGNLNWLEVVSYYRSIGGKNVFVYSVIEGDKRLIVDVLDDDSVVLINREGEVSINDYDTVMNSRKVFKYNEDIEQIPFTFRNQQYFIPVEILCSRDKEVNHR